jgi:chromatin remodeling complex protein RSC6
MPKAKKKTSKKPAKRKPSKLQPDDKLAAIVGSQPLPRSELTKKLWAYIKRHESSGKKKKTSVRRVSTKKKADKYISKHTRSAGPGTDSPGPGRAW